MRKYIKKINKVSIIILVIAFTLGLGGIIAVHAATSPTLVGSINYSVLGFTTVTNTGATTTTGEVGVSSGTSITGFDVPGGPGFAGGSNAIHVHSNDASAIAAQADNIVAFGSLNTGANASTQCLNPLNVGLGINNSAPDGTDLAGLTLGPGLYCSLGSFSLSNANGAGNPDLILTGAGPWVFKTASSTLITSTGSSVSVPNPTDACNVWWRVGSSATLGTSSDFKGNILALASVTLNTGATLYGRAMAQTGAVTLDTNTITGCAAPAATLNVIKDVITDNGGVATASDWVLTVASSDDGSGTGFADGTESGTIYTLETGHQYGVTENAGPSGYTPSSSDDCTIASAVTGTNYTCTITNNDIAPTLTLGKVVVDGEDDATDWTLTATGPTGFTGLGPTVNNGASFDIGTYNLSEAGPSDYDASDWVCVGGTQVDGDTVTLALDGDAVCTITNTRRQNISGSIAHVVAPIFQPTIDIISTPVVVANPVIVAPVVPKLPKTGFPPQEKNNLWNIVIGAGVLILVSTSLVLVLRKSKI